jgi:hypothetical protein
MHYSSAFWVPVHAKCTTLFFDNPCYHNSKKSGPRSLSGENYRNNEFSQKDFIPPYHHCRTSIVNSPVLPFVQLPPMGRKTYTATQKVSIVRAMEQRQKDNPQKPKTAICRERCVDPTQLHKWQKQLPTLLKKFTPIPGTRFNPGALAIHPGQKSSLHAMEHELL